MSLSPEMSLLLSKMTEQLNLQTATITENITAAILHQVDEKIKPIIEENEKLKQEVETLNKKILTLASITRKNNILIHGLPEENDEKFEDLSNLVKSTLRGIEVEIKTEDINILQRLGKKGSRDGKTRPILLATTSLQKKIQILKNKKKLKADIYITHDLPKEVLLAKKGNKNKNSGDSKKDTEKRKRSETPSPGNPIATNTKMHKIDAFQYLRQRSHSFSEKNTNKN